MILISKLLENESCSGFSELFLSTAGNCFKVRESEIIFRLRFEIVTDILLTILPLIIMAVKGFISLLLHCWSENKLIPHYSTKSVSNAISFPENNSLVH